MLAISNVHSRIKTINMKELSFLINHQSIPAKELAEPAPSAEQLEQILQCAMSAPDHGNLLPYRFLTIQGEARHELSLLFEQAVIRRDPDADDATILKQKNKPLRSPLIIVVIARLTDNPNIPEIEQLLSAGCAAQHIQLACSSLGYGSIWLTGENSYDLFIYESLGLDLNERIIGFIYIGTPAGDISRKSRVSARAITHRWEKPQHIDFAI